MTGAADKPFVSRAGSKLAHALDAFALDPRGLVCADFGANVGGFTDCLLQRGATRVHAVDTGYGVLDYRLRTDDRVVVCERTNALHAEPPADGVDFIVVDLGWTPQRLALPAALRWLRAGGRIVTLVKPHYEATAAARGRRLDKGQLDASEALAVTARVIEEMPGFGVCPLAACRSPLTGSKSSRRGAGNPEFLVLARQA